MGDIGLWVMVVMGQFKTSRHCGLNSQRSSGPAYRIFYVAHVLGTYFHDSPEAAGLAP